MTLSDGLAIGARPNVEDWLQVGEVGLISVRRDAVRGLTAAASIWVTAAIGTA
jgi:hypothetical protein